MPHIWLQDTEGAWAAAPLNGAAMALTGDPARPLLPRGGGGGPAALLRAGAAKPEAWVLLVAAARPDVRVNGSPVAGIRVLADRDEITVGAARVFYSSELLASVQPFPGERPVTCPRCKEPIVPGTPAVRCPSCSVWHHQTPERPCWTYSPGCTNCGQPTDLHAGFRWVPEVA